MFFWLHVEFFKANAFALKMWPLLLSAAQPVFWCVHNLNHVLAALVQTQLQRLQGEHRQEAEKSQALQAQLDEEARRRSQLSQQAAQQAQEVARLALRDRQAQTALAEARQSQQAAQEELARMQTYVPSYSFLRT